MSKSRGLRRFAITGFKFPLVAVIFGGMCLAAVPSVNAGTATNEVLILSKTASDTTPTVGQTISFTVTARNNGPHAVTNFTVVDLLNPTNFIFNTATPSQGTYDPTNGLWDIGVLGSALSRTLLLSVTVQTNTSALTLTNIASVTGFTGVDPIATNNTRQVTVLVGGSDISVTKTVNSNTATIGNKIVYTVSMTNKGPTAATGISLTDILPAGLSFFSEVDTQGTYDPTTGVWLIGNDNAGQGETLTITCTVTSAPGLVVSNTAFVSAVDQGDSIANNNSTSAIFIITGVNFTDFGLSKTVNTNAAEVGGTVIFTVAITNFGTNAASNVRVTDLLPSSLDYVTNSAGTNYNAASGLWTVGSLAVGDSSNLTITAKLNSSGAGQSVTNRASFQNASVADIFGANNTAVASFQAGRNSDADLTVPPQNLQTILAGAYIIPMDTNHQHFGTTVFNMNAYGLAAAMLYTNIPIKWAIRAGKQHDEADFSAYVKLINPGKEALTNTATQLLSFYAGPFIIEDTFTNRARTVIATYTNALNLVNSTNVTVYQLMSNVTVDIRYRLTHKPRIGVFNDGGTDAIHTDILDESGIPSNNYRVLPASQAGFLGNTSCYTFISSPHFDGGTTASQQTTSVRAFLESGGNFLAQCAAVRTYENSSGGQFQTTGGFQDQNDGSLFIYPNGDTPAAQFQGILDPAGGSLGDWGLLQLTSSDFKNHTYLTVQNADSTNAVAPNTNSFRSSVGKIITNGVGSVVFYLGGHNYGQSRTDNTTINGERIYMNAVFVPVDRPAECGITFTVDLGIQKSDNIDPIIQGSNLTYTIEVTNNGPGDATGVIVTDTLPAQVTFLSATPDFGSYNSTSRVWTIGVMSNGSYHAMTMNVNVSSNFVGIMTNLVIVTADQGDPVLTNSFDIEPTTVICEIEPPVITCPPDKTISCTESSDTNNTGSATATDNKDPNPIITFSNSVTAGSCAQASIIARTWKATDSCGNFSTCTQMIFIVDTNAPVLNGVPANTTNQCDNVSTAAVVTATDNCDTNVPVNFAETTNAGACAQSYVLVRVWSAGDDCSNTVAATQRVWVVDTTAPVITCATNSVTLQGDENCQAPLPALSASATDNCDTNVTITQNPPAGTVITGDSNTIVTLTATDACGNTNSCSVTVNLECFPAISIEKTVSTLGTFASSTEVATGTNTQHVTYYFVVSNPGDVTLTNVAVNDPLIPFTTNVGTLAVGQSKTVSVDDVISGDLTNTATVTGQDPLGSNQTDNDTAVVLQLMLIKGSVFVDFDIDGNFDPEDTNGISGAVITLLDSGFSIIGVTTTDVNGAYAFTGLPPGTYTVVEADRLGFYSTGDVVPPNDNLVPVTLVSGINATGRDFLDATSPNLDMDKTFIGVSEPDLLGNFAVTYLIEVNNPTGSNAEVYGLVDTPTPDDDVTILGGSVTGITNITLVGPGPYLFATNRLILPGTSHFYSVTLNAILSTGVLNGTTGITQCGQAGLTDGQGLLNKAVVGYGTNGVAITNYACGDIPPIIRIRKTFISASAPEASGHFDVTYVLTVDNRGGVDGTYSLIDTPTPDPNVTITGGVVSGQVTLSLTNGGPYILVTNDVAIADGATHTFTMQLFAVLSPGVLNGSTNVSLCGGQLPGLGLFNAATVTYGTNNTTLLTNDCGNIPPVIVPYKTFVSASAPSTSGVFQITYTVTAHNSGGSAGPYSLVDTPTPDTNITVSGGTVSGATNLALAGAGPYVLASNRTLAAGASDIYTLVLTGQVSLAVLNGSTNLTSCVQLNGTYVAGKGLFNAATITYGSNNVVVTTNDCGAPPPVIVPFKTFVAASAPSTNGVFTIVYTVTAHNSGGSAGPYNLVDTPTPDTNITIGGGSVIGATNLGLLGPGPYVLASNRTLAAGASDVYTLTLTGQLSFAVMTGSTNLTSCTQLNGTYVAGKGLFNAATITYGSNNIVITTNDCGNVPPIIVPYKTFVAASAPSTSGVFTIVYTVTAHNSGGSAGPYNLVDTPTPDTNITIGGGSVIGATNLGLLGPGPYVLASNRTLAAGASDVYTLTLTGQLSFAVMTGSTNLTSCTQLNGTYVAGKGLFNAATITYGSNNIVVTTNDCGNVPPVIQPFKTFVAASAPSTSGVFTIVYTVTAHNSGGSAGPYNLVDTPTPDTNITISGGAVSGATNLVLAGAGPYVLASNRTLAAGASDIYTLTLTGQLSLAVMTGSTNLSSCTQLSGTYVAGKGLFNAATITYGSNNLVVTTNDCGNVPPVLQLDKVFVAASAPTSNGNFQVVYLMTAHNSGGSAGTYNMTDTPTPDPNVTITGAVVTGQASLSFGNGGPYALAVGTPIAAGETHVYTMRVFAVLSPGVLSGSTNISLCTGSSDTSETPAKGLFNSVSITYGTNNLTITTNDCGNVPPVVVLKKTFVSAGNVNGDGSFLVTYLLTAHNSGSTAGNYDLTDTPTPDSNVTITGAVVSGQASFTNGTAGPYTLATGLAIGPGVTHTYTMQLYAVLSPGVLSGTTNVSPCASTAPGFQPGKGLFNAATVTYGTNFISFTTNDCGNTPPVPRYSIVKTRTVPAGSALVGEPITFTITVSNLGSVGFNPLPLTDTFNTNLLAFTNATPAPNTAVGNTLTWTNVGPLAPGQVTNITVFFRSIQTGSGTNTVITTPSTTNGIPWPPQTSSAPHTALSSSISGFVFKDVDADGIFDPEDITNGIPVVTITLLDAVSNVVGVTATDSTGFYIFTNLPVGVYTVVETDPAGYFSTADIVPPNDNRIPVTLTGVPSTGNNFLDTPPASVGDFVWDDSFFTTVYNGLQDPGEPGLSTNSYRFRLTLLDTNGVTVQITTQGLNGVYSFSNLFPKCYRIKMAIPVGTGVTTNDVGSNDNIDNDFHPLTLQTPIFCLNPGEARTNVDLGVFIIPNNANVVTVSTRVEEGRAILAWDVESAQGTAGWYVERQGSDGQWERASTFVPSSDSITLNGSYMWVDEKAQPGQSHTYRLQQIESRGSTRVLGPYKVTYIAPLPQ